MLRRDQWCICWWSRRKNWFTTFRWTWSWYFGIYFWWYSGIATLFFIFRLILTSHTYGQNTKKVANDDQTNIWLLATSERYWRFDPVNLYPTRYYNQCLEPRDKMGFPTSTSHQGRLQSHWWWCLWNRHWKHPYRAPTHGTTKSKSNSLSIWYLQSDMYFFIRPKEKSLLSLQQDIIQMMKSCWNLILEVKRANIRW